MEQEGSRGLIIQRPRQIEKWMLDSEDFEISLLFIGVNCSCTLGKLTFGRCHLGLQYLCVVRCLVCNGNYFRNGRATCASSRINFISGRQMKRDSPMETVAIIFRRCQAISSLSFSYAVTASYSCMNQFEGTQK
jgi:hypothetical protein